MFGADLRSVTIPGPKAPREVKLPEAIFPWKINDADPNKASKELNSIRLGIVSHEFGHIAPSLLLTDNDRASRLIVLNNQNVSPALLKEYFGNFDNNRNVGANIYLENIFFEYYGVPLRSRLHDPAGQVHSGEIDRINTFFGGQVIPAKR